MPLILRLCYHSHPPRNARLGTARRAGGLCASGKGRRESVDVSVGRNWFKQPVPPAAGKQKDAPWISLARYPSLRLPIL